jgi:hypothetical protein
MKIKTYNKSNIAEYEREFADTLNSLDIYYQPGYLLCDAAMQKGDLEIFTIKSDDGKKWIYPYILTPIALDETLLDIVAPYGYSGPFCNDTTFFKEGENAFVDYISSKPVVSEFIRYHWLYNREKKCKFSVNCTNIHNRVIVVLDTKKPFEQIWTQSFSNTNRNVIKKIEKGDFLWRIKIFEKADVSQFLKIYSETMNNASATDFYYFESLIDNLKGKIKLVTVEKEGICYSAALFFMTEEIATYYLSGRNVAFPQVSATNYLLGKMAEWCSVMGYKNINLGGGRTNSVNDSLFKFKKNFSKKNCDYYIGKRIHKPIVYEQLKELFIVKFGAEKYEKQKHFLQFYRTE